jgi:hypothetical protein
LKSLDYFACCRFFPDPCAVEGRGAEPRQTNLSAFGHDDSDDHWMTVLASPLPSRNHCLFFGTYEEEDDGVRKECQFSRNGLAATAGGAALADRSQEVPQDLRNLVRVVSACTLGLWAFAAGLLIGVFLFS